MDELYIQPDLFAHSDLDNLLLAITEVKRRGDNCRRGLFARHNDLAKMYYQMKEENDDLKNSLQELKKTVESLRESGYLLQTA